MFPKSQRLAVHAIYAFCRLADDIADDESIKGDVEIKAAEAAIPSLVLAESM